jgi:ABC-type Mn2+/Zn2+ transport system permease subunit
MVEILEMKFNWIMLDAVVFGFLGSFLGLYLFVTKEAFPSTNLFDIIYCMFICAILMELSSHRNKIRGNEK